MTEIKNTKIENAIAKTENFLTEIIAKETTRGIVPLAKQGFLTDLQKIKTTDINTVTLIDFISNIKRYTESTDDKVIDDILNELDETNPHYFSIRSYSIDGDKIQIMVDYFTTTKSICYHTYNDM